MNLLTLLFLAISALATKMKTKMMSQLELQACRGYDICRAHNFTTKLRVRRNMLTLSILNSKQASFQTKPQFAMCLISRQMVIVEKRQPNNERSKNVTIRTQNNNQCYQQSIGNRRLSLAGINCSIACYRLTG